jgi:integrase
MSPSCHAFLLGELKKMLTNLGSFDRQSFTNYLSDRELAPSTKATLASGIGKFLYYNNYISKEDYDILLKNFRQPHKQWSNKFLTKEQIENLITLAGEDAHMKLVRLRNPAIITVFATLGVRVSQLIGLNGDDIEYHGDIMTLKIQKKKDVQKDLIPMLDIKELPLDMNIGKFNVGDTITRYEKYRKTYLGRKAQSTQWLIGRKGIPLTVLSVQVLIRHLGKMLGLDITTHSFRHYVATNVANKVGIHQAAILLGHARIETTMKYVNPASSSTLQMIKEAL